MLRVRLSSALIRLHEQPSLSFCGRGEALLEHAWRVIIADSLHRTLSR